MAKTPSKCTVPSPRCCPTPLPRDAGQRSQPDRSTRAADAQAPHPHHHRRRQRVVEMSPYDLSKGRITFRHLARSSGWCRRSAPAAPALSPRGGIAALSSPAALGAARRFTRSPLPLHARNDQGTRRVSGHDHYPQRRPPRCKPPPAVRNTPPKTSAASSTACSPPPASTAGGFCRHRRRLARCRRAARPCQHRDQHERHRPATGTGCHRRRGRRVAALLRAARRRRQVAGRPWCRRSSASTNTSATSAAASHTRATSRSRLNSSFRQGDPTTQPDIPAIPQKHRRLLGARRPGHGRPRRLRAAWSASQGGDPPRPAITGFASVGASPGCTPRTKPSVKPAWRGGGRLERRCFESSTRAPARRHGSTARAGAGVHGGQTRASCSPTRRRWRRGPPRAPQQPSTSIPTHPTPSTPITGRATARRRPRTAGSARRTFGAASAGALACRTLRRRVPHGMRHPDGCRTHQAGARDQRTPGR